MQTSSYCIRHSAVGCFPILHLPLRCVIIFRDRRQGISPLPVDPLDGVALSCKIYATKPNSTLVEVRFMRSLKAWQERFSAAKVFRVAASPLHPNTNLATQPGSLKMNIISSLNLALKSREQVSSRYSVPEHYFKNFSHNSLLWVITGYRRYRIYIFLVCFFHLLQRK